MLGQEDTSGECPNHDACAEQHYCPCRPLPLVRWHYGICNGFRRVHLGPNRRKGGIVTTTTWPLPCLVSPCLAWPCLALSFLALPGPTWPGLALSGLALPCLALPGLAWPGIECIPPTGIRGTHTNRYDVYTSSHHSSYALSTADFCSPLITHASSTFTWNARRRLKISGQCR